MSKGSKSLLNPGFLTYLDDSQWWQLFIDKPHHNAQAGMRYDQDRSPGYYASMMAAISEAIVAPESFSRIEFKQYQSFHDLVTKGCESKELLSELYAEKK